MVRIRNLLNNTRIRNLLNNTHKHSSSIHVLTFQFSRIAVKDNWRFFFKIAALKSTSLYDEKGNTNIFWRWHTWKRYYICYHLHCRMISSPTGAATTFKLNDDFLNWAKLSLTATCFRDHNFFWKITKMLWSDSFTNKMKPLKFAFSSQLWLRNSVGSSVGQQVFERHWIDSRCLLNFIIRVSKGEILIRLTLFF